MGKGKNMGKTGIYALITVILILSLAPSSISRGQIVSSVALAFSGTISHSALAPTYFISQTGTVTNVVNGTSGQIVYSNANANLAFNKAFGYVANGGSITVQAGTYTANGSSILMQNCQNVTVSFQPNALLTITNWVNDSVFEMWRCTDCIISGINIDGNGANQGGTAIWNDNGILLGDCSNCVVKEATITNCRGYGFSSGNNLPGYNFNGITNSVITFCEWNGVTLGWGGPYTIGDYAINNTIAYCGDCGISGQCAGAIIRGNYIHDMNGTLGAELPNQSAHYGIAVEAEPPDGNTGYVTIENNVIVNCVGTWSGVGIQIGTGGPIWSNLVRNNTIINCSSGINVAHSSGDVITQNQIINWGTQPGAYGMDIYDSSNEIISFNSISSTSTASSLGPPLVLESSTTNCSVCNNTITEQLSVSDQGISLSSGANYNVIEGNNVQAATGISIGSGCTSNRVYQNTLSNCTTQISNGGTGTITTFASPAILTLNCPSYYGTISPVAGSYSRSTSSQVTITLTPSATYTPVLNVDGVNVNLADNAYTLLMDRDHVVYAIFSRSE